MFERYTEKARCVIFFARYEASQYGSRYIGSEHILLGLFREDPALMNRAVSTRSSADEIRKEIEKGIEPRERISTSVEVPLAQDSVKILRFAADEAGQLGHRYVGTEHIVLGILMTPESLAGRMLMERVPSLAWFRSQVEQGVGFGREGWRLRQSDEATATIDALLAGIGSSKWTDLSSYFAADAEFVDSTGKRWKGREEIGNQFETLFLPYAKKGVTFILEGVDAGAIDTFVARVLWENVTVAGGTLRSMHRMTIIVEKKGRDCVVFFIQVTPVRIP
jgi:ketosteroid isomerase-like protein